MVWLTNERRLALFPAETIVRNPHHGESLILREQDLNLRRKKRTKRPENSFLTLTVNYRKFVQKRKLYHLKQPYISYLMIYDVI